MTTAARWDDTQLLGDWLKSRLLELVYTCHDLTALARESGYNGPPFPWDERRRFELRCELDAAFFHLYLPTEPDGGWRLADGETATQLSALKHHFATPRDAVAYILDQFPIVRRKDEAAFSWYRTKDCILEIYDAMLAAQRSNQTLSKSPRPAARDTEYGHDLQGNHPEFQALSGAD